MMDASLAIAERMGVLAYFKGFFELFLLGDCGGGIVGVVFVAFEDGVVRSANARRC